MTRAPAPYAGGAPGADPYRNPFRSARIQPSRIDQGVDYFAPAGDPIYAIGPAVIDQVYSSGSGWPGGGWVSYRLTKGSLAGQRIYVAEDIAPASVRVGQRVDSNTVIAHFNQSGSIETGYAGPLNLGDQTLAAHLNEWATTGGDPGRYSTQAGVAFSNLLASLGAPAGYLTPGGIRGPNQQIVSVPVTQTAPAGGPSGPGSSGTGAGANCLIGFHGVSVPVAGQVGQFCVISKSQARAIAGGVMLGGAAVFALPVVAIMLITVLGRTKAGAAAAKAGGSVLELAGAGASLAGAPELGAPVAAAGSAVKRGGAASSAGRYARRARSTTRAADAQQRRADERTAREQAAQERHTAAQYRRQPHARANYERDAGREPAPF